MRALVLHEWGGPFGMEERAVPEPEAGAVLVRVRACGVGLTLNNIRDGRMSSSPNASLPRVIGHEVAGEVVRAGPGASTWAPGDRVVAYFYLTCGRCAACRWGHDPLCANFEGFLGVARDGGFADYLTVPEDNLLAVPEGVGMVDAAVTADAIATPWHALGTVAHLRPTDTLAVIGAGGGVGIHAVQVGRLLGARVIAVDVTDEKLELAREHGADAGVDGRQDVAGRVKELTGGRGADVVLDYVTTEDTLTAGFDSLASGGRLVIQGVNPPGAQLRAVPRTFIQKEAAVVGSRYASRRELAEALELVRRGTVTPVVTRTGGLDEASDMMAALAERELLGRGAIVLDGDEG